MENRATNRLKCAETVVHHINHTPPEAGTPHLHSKCKGQASEPLCVPPEKGAPRGVEQKNRKGEALSSFFTKDLSETYLCEVS